MQTSPVMGTEPTKVEKEILSDEKEEESELFDSARNSEILMGLPNSSMMTMMISHQVPKQQRMELYEHFKLSA